MTSSLGASQVISAPDNAAMTALGPDDTRFISLSSLEELETWLAKEGHVDMMEGIRRSLEGDDFQPGPPSGTGWGPHNPEVDTMLAPDPFGYPYDRHARTLSTIAEVLDVHIGSVANFPDHSWGPNPIPPLGQVIDPQPIQADQGYQEPAPVQTFREHHGVCDLNGDEHRDMLVHSWDWRYAKSDLVAVSGKTGETLWVHDNMQYTMVPFIVIPEYQYPAPFRPGEPMPYFPIAPPPTFVPAPDLNGDGVCDFLAYGFHLDITGIVVPLPPGGMVVVMVGEFLGSLRMISGATGAAEWSLPIQASYLHTLVIDPLGNPRSETYDLEGFPTGLHVFDAQNQTRFAFKTTDIDWKFVLGAGNVFIDENIQLGDAHTGETIWNRTITNTGLIGTWLSGDAEVTGDGEPEIVLDDTTLRVRVLHGSPSLAGEDYYQVNYFNEVHSGELSFEEEDCRAPVWMRAYPVGDIDGDGHPEIIGQYLSIPCPVLLSSEVSSPMGSLRTHFTPINGREGTKLWPAIDTQMQGWGFATDLNTEDGSIPLLALGTVDFFIQVPGARFPDIEVRVAVHDVHDGAPRWSYSERTSLDDVLANDLALRHFQRSLAPSDLNGDGVRDILVPPAYRIPVSQNLISMAEHDYQVIGSQSGETISEFSAWGMTGNVLPCQESGAEITVMSGHARRTDISRIDMSTGETQWRVPVYNNPVQVSQVAGRAVLYMDGACNPVTGNKTMVGLNTGVDSLQRGYEVLNVLGAIKDDNATTAWIHPEMPWVPALDWHGGQLIVQAASPTGGLVAAFTFAPVIPGILVGALWGYFRYKLPSKEGTH